MADNGGLPLELADGVSIVVRDLLNPFVGKDLRVVIRVCNGLRVVRPARRERRVALLFKQLAPVVPTAGKKPEAMYEDDRLFPLHVGMVDLLLFMHRENCHIILLWCV